MTDFEHLQGTEFEEYGEVYKNLLTEGSGGWSVDAPTIYQLLTALNDALGREKAKDLRIAGLELAVEYLEPNHRLLEENDV